MTDDERIEAIAAELCDWFELTQSPHNDDFPAVCSFHREEAAVAYGAVKGQLAEKDAEIERLREAIIEPGTVPPWMEPFDIDYDISSSVAHDDRWPAAYWRMKDEPK